MKEITCEYHYEYIKKVFRFLSPTDQQLFTNSSSLTSPTFEQTLIDADNLKCEFAVLDFKLNNS